MINKLYLLAVLNFTILSGLSQEMPVNFKIQYEKNRENGEAKRKNLVQFQVENGEFQYARITSGLLDTKSGKAIESTYYLDGDVVKEQFENIYSVNTNDTKSLFLSVYPLYFFHDDIIRIYKKRDVEPKLKNLSEKVNAYETIVLEDPELLVLLSKLLTLYEGEKAESLWRVFRMFETDKYFRTFITENQEKFTKGGSNKRSFLKNINQNLGRISINYTTLENGLPCRFTMISEKKGLIFHWDPDPFIHDDDIDLWVPSEDLTEVKELELYKDFTNKLATLKK